MINDGRGIVLHNRTAHSRESGREREASDSNVPRLDNECPSQPFAADSASQTQLKSYVVGGSNSSGTTRSRRLFGAKKRPSGEGGGSATEAVIGSWPRGAKGRGE